MKIIHVTPLLRGGGVEFVASKIVNELLRIGVDARHITYSDFLKLKEHEKSDTIYHLHNLHYPLSLLGILKVRRFGLRYVFSPHYHGRASSSVVNIVFPLWKKIWKNFLRGSATHAVSPYEAELLRRDFNISPIIIEHGVDEDIKPLKKEPYLLYSGRLEKYKRVDKVLSLGKRLFESGVIEEVHIVGQGPDIERLKKIASRLNIKVRFMEPLPRRDYIIEVGKALISANLSELEAFSLFAAESLKAGAITIVRYPWGLHFRRCPNALIVHDVDKNYENLADRLKSIIGMNRRCTFKSWEEVAREYLTKLYYNVV